MSCSNWTWTKAAEPSSETNLSPSDDCCCSLAASRSATPELVLCPAVFQPLFGFVQLRLRRFQLGPLRLQLGAGLLGHRGLAGGLKLLDLRLGGLDLLQPRLQLCLARIQFGPAVVELLRRGFQLLFAVGNFFRCGVQRGLQVHRVRGALDGAQLGQVSGDPGNGVLLLGSESLAVRRRENNGAESA